MPYMVFVFWWNVSSWFFLLCTRKITLSFTHLFFYCQVTGGEKKHMKKMGENAEKRKKSLKNWRWIITQSSKSNWESANYPAPKCGMNKCLLHCHSSHKPEHGDGISDSKKCLLTAVATRKLSMLGELDLSCFATVSLEILRWPRRNGSNCSSVTPQSVNHSPHLFQNSKAEDQWSTFWFFFFWWMNVTG